MIFLADKVKQNFITRKQRTTNEDFSNSKEQYYTIYFEDHIRLIHVYGKPGAGKTTLALQYALETVPEKTYMFITSGSHSTLERLKQLEKTQRWKNSNIKRFFYPIFISDMDSFIKKLLQLKKLQKREINLVIIDHITDYVRGLLHKEEIKNRLRVILEHLVILAKEKDCTILIINGTSFNGKAAGQDLIESFCDVNIKIKRVNNHCQLVIEPEQEIFTSLSNEGLDDVKIEMKKR